MNVALPAAGKVIASATLFAALSCVRKPSSTLDLLHAAPMCDTTPMTLWL